MAISRAPQNKAIAAAPANKAGAVHTVQTLALEHGRVLCSCDRVIAACQHVGHAQVLRVIERGCDVCSGG